MENILLMLLALLVKERITIESLQTGQFLVSLPYTPWRFCLRPLQAVAQWGGTHARRHQTLTTEIEKSHFLNEKIQKLNGNIGASE